MGNERIFVRAKTQKRGVGAVLGGALGQLVLQGPGRGLEAPGVVRLGGRGDRGTRRDDGCGGIN